MSPIPFQSDFSYTSILAEKPKSDATVTFADSYMPWKLFFACGIVHAT